MKAKQHKRGTIAHLFRAFAHPSLRMLSKQKAKEILKKDKEYIGEGFYEMAEKIVYQDEYPEWNTSNSDE